MRGTVSSASEGALVRLLPLTIGTHQLGAHPFLAFQHRTISAVVLSSRLVIWGTSGQVITHYKPRYLRRGCRGEVLVVGIATGKDPPNSR